MQLSCPDIDAHWKLSVRSDQPSILKETKEGKIIGQEFPMLANIFRTNLFVAAHFEIISIKYNDNTPDYDKEICIKESCKFKWDIDKEMIEKFRAFKPAQICLSDTFDEENNNWGLWIVPQDMLLIIWLILNFIYIICLLRLNLLMS